MIDKNYFILFFYKLYVEILFSETNAAIEINVRDAITAVFRLLRGTVEKVTQTH